MRKSPVRSKCCRVQALWLLPSRPPAPSRPATTSIKIGWQKSRSAPGPSDQRSTLWCVKWDDLQVDRMRRLGFAVRRVWTCKPDHSERYIPATCHDDRDNLSRRCPPSRRRWSRHQITVTAEARSRQQQQGRRHLAHRCSADSRTACSSTLRRKTSKRTALSFSWTSGRHRGRSPSQVGSRGVMRRARRREWRLRPG